MMMTLTHSAATVIRLTQFSENVYYHKRKAQSISVNTVNTLYNYSAYILVTPFFQNLLTDLLIGCQINRVRLYM